MRKIALALGATVFLAGCAGMSETEQRAVTGTGIGAAGGAVIGAMAGNAGLGAVIGAGAGLAGGLLVDKSKKNEQAAYQSGYAAGQKGH
jgi:osmotically inducible lipoprotein OsmB